MTKTIKHQLIYIATNKEFQNLKRSASPDNMTYIQNGVVKKVEYIDDTDINGNKIKVPDLDVAWGYVIFVNQTKQLYYNNINYKTPLDHKTIDIYNWALINGQLVNTTTENIELLDSLEDNPKNTRIHFQYFTVLNGVRVTNDLFFNYAGESFIIKNNIKESTFYFHCVHEHQFIILKVSYKHSDIPLTLSFIYSEVYGVNEVYNFSQFKTQGKNIYDYNLSYSTVNNPELYDRIISAYNNKFILHINCEFTQNKSYLLTPDYDTYINTNGIISLNYKINYEDEEIYCNISGGRNNLNFNFYGDFNKVVSSDMTNNMLLFKNHYNYTIINVNPNWSTPIVLNFQEFKLNTTYTITINQTVNLTNYNFTQKLIKILNTEKQAGEPLFLNITPGIYTLKLITHPYTTGKLNINIEYPNNVLMCNNLSS